MKAIGTTIVALFLIASFALAQDTLYVYKAGVVAYKSTVSSIDSIAFYKKYSTPTIPTTVTDIDGNVYHTVTIGTQTWLVENLKTTRYNDGIAIPLVTSHEDDWWNLSTPGYCWYKNDAATYKNIYGALYNWYAVNTGKLAPMGWHVATNAEWTTLGSYLTANGYNYDGSTIGNYYAKSLAATTNWATAIGAGTIGNDLSKNNHTGFSALPGGLRGLNGFDGAGVYGGWWSSTGSSTDSAWAWSMNYDNSSLSQLYDLYENTGFSVRCVRNN